MNKKYFDTRTGSLEDAIVKVATEQPSITKQEPNVRLETKTYFETKPGSISDVASKIVSEALDPVNKDAVKKDFKDRQDKDIDNDGDTDSTDKYLHKRRAAISKNIKEDDMAKFHKMQKDGKSADDIAKALGLDVKSVKKLMDLDEVVNPYAVGMAQAMKSKNDKPPLEKSTITKAHDIAKSIMKKEQTDEVCPKCGKVHLSASCGSKHESKTFEQLRTETKEIQLGDKGKSLTGKKAGVIDVEPRAKPV